MIVAGNLTVETKEMTYPRKGTEYAVVLKDANDRQVCSVRPFTPYLAEAEMSQKAFEVLLSSPEGQAFVKAKVEELP